MDRIKKQATYENLDSILSFLRKNLNNYGADKEIIPDVVLAVEELVVNIVSYAFPDKENGNVEISCKLDKNKVLIVSIEDEGIPFDVLASEDPDTSTPINERGIGGMGIFLVKNVVDDIKYQRKNGKNILTIKKSLKSE